MPGQEEVTAVVRGVQSVDGRIQETNVPLRRVSRVVTKLNSIHFSGSILKYVIPGLKVGWKEVRVTCRNHYISKNISIC